jgi:hypothetical protein
MYLTRCAGDSMAEFSLVFPAQVRLAPWTLPLDDGEENEVAVNSQLPGKARPRGFLKFMYRGHKGM